MHKHPFFAFIMRNLDTLFIKKFILITFCRIIKTVKNYLIKSFIADDVLLVNRLPSFSFVGHRCLPSPF